MSNKKQKLFVGLCVAAATTILAGGIAALAISLTNKNKTIDPLVNSKTVTFMPGNGSFKDNQNSTSTVEAGTTLDKIPQPEVVLPKGKMFTGWTSQDGKPVRGKQTINNNVTLTASSDDLTSDYAVVKFQKSSQINGCVLQGNVSLAAKKGYYFYMLNRPAVSLTGIDANNYYFHGWIYSQACGTHAAGDDVLENDEITDDCVIEPKFTQAIKLTWHAGENAQIVRGQEQTTFEYATHFSQLNQPQIESLDGKTFAGWYHDEQCTDAWGETEEVTENCHAWAKWQDDPRPASKYVTVQFEAEPIPGKEFIITPSNSLIVEKGMPFNQTNRPTIVEKDKNDYTVGKWVYRLDTSSEWEDLQDDYAFYSDTTYVKAIMVESVQDVLAFASNTNPLPEQTVQCTSKVLGAETSTVSWEIYADTKCTEKLDPSIATINQNGLVKVESVEVSSPFYVQATSTLSPIYKSEPLEFVIKMPWENSLDVWYHDTSTSQHKWWCLSQDKLCNIGDEITPVDLNGVEKTIPLKATDPFNFPLIFGDQISMIHPNFCSNWTGFNGYLSIDISNVEYISYNFMQNCTSFNNGGTGLFLMDIASIGDNFMSGCTSYNEPIAFYKNTKLSSIGDNFMQGCTNFNSYVWLPDYTSSLTIGKAFLLDCSSFNKDIYFPEVTVSVGENCMYGCNNFKSIITVDCPANVFNGKNYDFAGESIDSDIFKIGFKVSGAYANDFATRFPTQSTIAYAYRTVTVE